MHLHARISLWTLSCVVLSQVSTAPASCPSEHERHPLLGEYKPTHSGHEVVLTVQQNDIDVEIVVRQGHALNVFDAPGGRNGREWVLLGSVNPETTEVCFYSVFGQHIANAYRVTETESSTLDPASRQSFSELSEAGSLWAKASEAARTTAISRYEFVANHASQSELREYARLYAAAAEIQRYQYDAALANLKHLTASASSSPDIAYASHWLMGAIFNRRNELPAATASLDRALALARQAEQQLRRSVHRDIVEITNLAGEVQLSSGQIERGASLIEQARVQSGTDHELLGKVHNNLGFVDILRADRASLAERPKFLSLSLEDHFIARDHSLHAGDLQELAIIENNIASLFERVGDLRKAREHYEEALRLIGTTDDPLRLEVLYRNLGHVYQYLGDYEKSEQFTEAALRISESAAPNDAVRLHCRLGTLHRLRDRLIDAVREHSLCRDRAAAAHLTRDQAEALYELAVDQDQQHDRASANRAIEQASALLSQVQDRDITSKIQAQHALLLQSQGKSEMARRLADASIAASQAARYPTARVDALAAAMTIQIAQGDRVAAMNYGLRALDAIDALHAHLDAERLGPAWSARTRAVYDELAELAIANYQARKDRRDLEQALQILERGRAISLRQQLSAPVAVHAQLASSPLLATLSTIASDHARGASDPLPLAYYHAHDLLTRSRLAGVADVPVPPPLSLAQVQRSLSSTDTALYYFFTSTRAFVFVITRGDIRLMDLGERSTIDGAAETLRKSFASGPGSSIEPLKRLSQRLLPESSIAQAGALIFVPDGSLHSMPFAALHLGSMALPYQPLIARHTIKVSPSLSTYLMPKAKPSTSHDVDLAVFANPLFDESAATVPLRNTQALPSTQREAEQLRALFAPERTRVFTRAAANRSNLLSEAARTSRVLHIASHGHFDSASPDNVGFALSTRRSRAGFDSGFVTLTELFTQPFDNDLVVISGCDTAMGLQREGEGMMSVSRAFIAQGASHVIATLWAVSDQASAEFMPLFYSRLASSGSISGSLQYAQQQLRARKPYSDPFFWAPYVMTTVQPDDTLRFEAASAQSEQAKKKPPQLSSRRL